MRMRCAACREFAANDSERGDGQNRKLGPDLEANTKFDSMKDTSRTGFSCWIGSELQGTDGQRNGADDMGVGGWTSSASGLVSFKVLMN